MVMSQKNIKNNITASPTPASPSGIRDGSSASPTPSSSTPSHEGKSKDGGFGYWFRKILTYMIPVAISVALIVWLFKKVNFHEVMRIARTECDFFWIAMMMGFTAAAMLIRGIRWGIQLRGAGLKRVPVMTEATSIFGAYALNLVFPQLGEAWRCVDMARREKAPLATVIGTDVGDRGSDAAVILLLLILTLIVARSYMEKFLDHYSFGEHLEHYTDNPWLWIGIIAFVTIAWATLHFFTRYKVVKEIDHDLADIWHGFKVLFTMKGRGLYVVLTFGIWGCYFMETYCGFLAFPFTRHLITDPGSCFGLIPGLVVFVFGSCSMAVPSNGGLGPWNLAVMFALSLYGIGDTEGTAYSMVMWSFQAAVYVILGLVSAFYISSLNKKASAPGSTRSVNP